MKTVSDKIIVTLINNKDIKTEAGIIIPDIVIAKDDQFEAKVLAVGPGNGVEKMVINVGDIVICPKNVGTKLSYNNDEVIALRASQIHLVK